MLINSFNIIYCLLTGDQTLFWAVEECLGKIALTELAFQGGKKASNKQDTIIWDKHHVEN